MGAVVAGGTVAGPGLSWDEPAYRHSQLTLQCWLRELSQATSISEAFELFSKESIHHYWQFNRFGHNFHPPMASYLNLATFGFMHRFWDDISSRRLASALEFAAAATILCHFLGRRCGAFVGLFAGLTLLTMPRVMGDAHIIGTDMPLLFLWAASAVCFWNGLASRRWQWMFAFLFACLFLVKFSGVLLAAPVIVSFLGVALVRAPYVAWGRWLAWTLAIAAPLAYPAVLILRGGNDNLSQLCFLGPLVVLLAFYWRNRSTEQLQWDVALETPWVTLAITPLACVLLNPTWWHDTPAALTSYLDLNLNRQGHLPDIGIFYLGKQYVYSLPWHNAYVLMAVTIPFGSLVLGLIGLGLTIPRAVQRDWLPAYFALHAFTLPIFRMLPTPAHDGVRLFLPTFFFWAGLTGIAAGWLVQRLAGRLAPRVVGQSGTGHAGPKGRNRLAQGRAQRRPGSPMESSSEALKGRNNGVVFAARLALFLVGPAWAAVEWARIHPYELSYYNVGLARAVDLGFEPTYWYDALTPAALADINAKIPPNQTVVYKIDEMVNPEVFQSLQELGRLRSDISLDAAQAEGFPWIFLLTHSSKATAMRRLIYACKPTLEYGPFGVRLFSVTDSRGLALAFCLRLFAVEKDEGVQRGVPILHEPIFRTGAAELTRAVSLIRTHGADAVNRLGAEPPAVQELVHRFVAPAGVNPFLERILQQDPDAVSDAIRIITTRPHDLRAVLNNPGYLLPERFGGYFE